MSKEEPIIILMNMIIVGKKDTSYMEQHAFIIPAHHQPQLLARILKVLEAPNHYFFIHINEKSGDLTPFVEATKDIGNVHFVDRIKIYHGDISQIYATLIMMKAVVDSGIQFSYVHQITGQDYPLRSNVQFDAFFHGKRESYFFFDNIKKYSKKVLKKQHNRVYYFRPQLQDCKFLKILYYGLNIQRFVHLFVKRDEIKNFATGSDWFSIHISVVKFILDYNQKHPEFLGRFVSTSSPSEIYYHSLLSPYISKFHIHTDQPLRYISFVPHRAVKTKYRPFLLNEQDYEYVIDSAAFFCRKVDLYESAKLMDMIDNQRGHEYDISKHTSIF